MTGSTARRHGVVPKNSHGLSSEVVHRSGDTDIFETSWMRTDGEDLGGVLSLKTNSVYIYNQ